MKTAPTRTQITAIFLREVVFKQKRKIWVAPWKSPENKSCIQTGATSQKPDGSSSSSQSVNTG